MIFKLLLLVLVGTIVYFAFFRKKEEQKVESQNRGQDFSGDELIPCEKCGTLTSENETIIHNGKQFCSKECAGL
jgi:uncharacterized protein